MHCRRQRRKIPEREILVACKEEYENGLQQDQNVEDERQALYSLVFVLGKWGECSC